MTTFPQSTNDISPIINGMFFGYAVSTVLLGMTIVQGWTYFHSNQDKWPLRAFVALLILLDIADTCCSTELLHHYLITHFGDHEVLQQRSIVISVDFMITAFTFFLVHGYYARSLYLVSQSPWLPGTIVILSTAMIIVGFFPVNTAAKDQPLDSDNQDEIIYLTIFHSLAIFTDFLITLSLTITFWRMGKSFITSHSLLHRLIIYTTSRGILVTVAQIAHITMFLLNPTKFFFWSSVHLILGKLYVTSTLVMLNHRNSLRNEDVSVVDLLEFNTKSASDTEDAIEDNTAMRRNFRER